MSFDIAKYPTLALVDWPRSQFLPKESLPKLVTNCARYLLDSAEPFQRPFASGLGTVN
ncbi:hypothetical protein ACLB1O_16785 [Escherichia coli]